MNRQQNLAELLLLPWEELKTYQGLVSDIVSLRGRLEAAAEPPPARPTPALPGSAGHCGLRERSPLRPPKPGSLRAEIHRILEEAGKPLRRSDVIEMVASRRGVPLDATLKAKVGDHLTNRHDPFVRKIAQGVYQYVPQPAGGAPCL